MIELEPHFGVLILLDYEFKKDYAPYGYEKSDHLLSLIKNGVFFTDEREKSSYRQFNEMMIEMEQLHLTNDSHREEVERRINEAVERLKIFDKVWKKMLHKVRSQKHKFSRKLQSTTARHKRK